MRYDIIRDCENVKVVRNKCYQWGVVDDEGEFIVPFGVYSWIDGFENGLARVKKGIGDNARWGIINDDGEVVLPVKYDKVWNFFRMERTDTTVELNGVRQRVDLDALGPRWVDDFPEDMDSSDSSDKDDDNDDYSYADPYDNYFSVNDCYDSQGHFDYESYEDAIMDGECVADDW